MSYQYSNEIILKQLCSGLLSGSAIGILIRKGHYVLSYITFTSIGLIDFAYHFNYLKSHITHLTHDSSNNRTNVRTRLTNLQRNFQRELREPSDDDVSQELQWCLNDVRRYIDQHIYYGMGFTLAFLMSMALVPKK